ncbi:hypothetical protein [Bacillus cihuensis]|uniref:hypothetical protein n=1 Tax=Bacillus cihuensis TaxID=1208599 RepID=UPI0003F7D275|nr:hypothetical protein [Bacillus cihuensis]
MNKIELTYEGTVFSKIAGNEKKTMYYNEDLNNLLIVTTDEKVEMQKFYAESLAEELKNGDIDEDEVAFDEKGNIIITLNDEDFNDTIEDALGYIVGDRWDDLCSSAEYANDTTILIHKPYHTTTDFTVNYDLNPKELLDRPLSETIVAFEDLVPGNKNEQGHEVARCYKLVEIMGGKAYRYGEIPEEVFEAYFK